MNKEYYHRHGPRRSVVFLAFVVYFSIFLYITITVYVIPYRNTRTCPGRCDPPVRQCYAESDCLRADPNTAIQLVRGASLTQ